MSSSDEADSRDHTRSRGARPTLGALAWLGILVAIAVVQLARGQWGDAVIFGIAAVVTTADAAAMLRPLDRLPRPARVGVFVGAGVAAVALTLLPRHSVASGLAMIAIGVVALAVSWGPSRDTEQQTTRWPRMLRVLGWSWAVVWIAACLWELLELILGGTTAGGRAAHPALSDILNPFLDQLAGKFAFVVIWLAIGLFLVRRGSRS